MNTKPQELETVALTTDLPEHGLLRGQVGTIVHVHGGGAAYEVEFVDDSGRTYGLLPLKPDQFLVLRYKASKVA